MDKQKIKKVTNTKSSLFLLILTELGTKNEPNEAR